MQLSFTAVLALLAAAAQPALAWSIATYESTKRCAIGKPNRILRSYNGHQENTCLTIGRSLPGVGCIEYQPLKSPGITLPCRGSLGANSIQVSMNTACWLWVEEDCNGEPTASNIVNECIQPGDANWNFKSFKCVSTSGSVSSRGDGDRVVR
ncbi:hypothetical protein BT67DRAFT_169831 [Trichocladium antarcticum]|uniref:Cyanovirin-N domain-containing protein n=1 Tax=Trichocladium antarcticum TaxID=1450529 RepID=A0AAN6ZB94_9PEZI|nr:hypothetical protein BT67DRAFT_169831 [Trichocladium antarcticum]